MPILTYATATMAAGLLATSASQFAARAVNRWQRQRLVGNLRAGLQQELIREAQHARLSGELNWQQRQAANAASLRVLEVVEMVDESEDCRSFYLQDPLGVPLPEFLPGQFVTVRPALGGYGLPTRCYSLSDSPGMPWWRITVKRHLCTSADRALAEDSGVSIGLSQWLHDQIKVGDSLVVSQPAGEFVVPEHIAHNQSQTSATPLVMLAAGIGITPCLSMTKSILQRCNAAPLALFFQAQDQQHWPFGKTLHEWSATCTAFHVQSYFSRTSDLPSVQSGEVHSGKYDASCVLSAINRWQSNRAGESRANNSTPANRAHFFLCGPNVWMEQLIADLQKAGVPNDHIHHESFGSGSTGESITEPIAPWTLELSGSGLTINNCTKRQSIWQAAKEHGVELPAACHNGVCGSCKLRVLRGAVEYQRQPTCNVANDEALACVARPVGHVVVDA